MENEMIINVARSALLRVKQARLDLEKNLIIRSDRNLQAVHDILVDLVRKVEPKDESN